MKQIYTGYFWTGLIAVNVSRAFVWFIKSYFSVKIVSLIYYMGFGNKYFNRISLDNMLYFHN